MRCSLITLLVSSSSGCVEAPTLPATVEGDEAPAPTGGNEALAPAEAPTPVLDADGDRVLDDCDVCPDDPETWNGILDLDGCPDSSGTSHAVVYHATNRFSSVSWQPALIEGRTLVEIEPESAVFFREDLRGAEEIVCVGQATPSEDEPARLSAERARSLCAALRVAGVLPEAAWSERSVGAGRVFRSAAAFEARSRAGLLVTRADDLELWRWDGAAYVRATPALRLHYDPPLAPGCESRE